MIQTFSEKNAHSKPLFHPRTSRSVIIRLVFASCICAFGVWLVPNFALMGGWAIGLWVFSLSLICLVIKPIKANRKQLITGAGIAGFGLLPVCLSLNAVSFLWAVLTSLIFALIVSGELHRGAGSVRKIIGFLIIPFIGIFGFCSELMKQWSLDGKKPKGRSCFYSLVGWIMPLVCIAVFILLFAQANPLIESFFAHFEFDAFDSSGFQKNLVKFILLFLFSCSYWISNYHSLLSRWFGLSFKTKIPESHKQAEKPIQHSAFFNALFGNTAILRALILFNILFALQNGMDIAYLALNMDLPDGMTYATYAHRGAYPLVITALLAAGFVLLVMREGKEHAHAKILHGLVYLWIVQNIILVLSSLIRLSFYVEAYSLTYWRVAAFLWMGLVAAGLVFIILRIALKRSNTWLVWMNMASTVLVLYVFALCNVSSGIANYNINSWKHGHSSLDLCYFPKMGMDILPELDRVLSEMNEENSTRIRLECEEQGYYTTDPETARREVIYLRSQLAKSIEKSQVDWRFQDFRIYHLIQYSKNHHMTASF